MHYFKGIKGLCCLLLFINWPSFAENPSYICDSSYENPCIVQDSNTQYTSLIWFRDISNIAKTYPSNYEGLEDLFVSGSEAPSAQGWKEIGAYIYKNKKSKDQPVVVIDLRQESHGYLNGRAITLVHSYNWINLGKTDKQSALDEQVWLNKLSSKRKIKGILSPLQYLARDYYHGKSMVQQSIHDEEFYVNKLGFTYRRLFITDHRAPLDSDVDAFLDILKSNPSNTWYHIHCRGGKGRTTTFFALFDIFKNAWKVSFEDIIARQASIPPYYNLMETNRKDSELTPYYEQRAVFLHQFYQYARFVHMGYKGTWSEWKAHNSNIF